MLAAEPRGIWPRHSPRYADQQEDQAPKSQRSPFSRSTRYRRRRFAGSASCAGLLLTPSTPPRSLNDICDPPAASRAVALAAGRRALLPDIAIALAALAARSLLAPPLPIHHRVKAPTRVPGRHLTARLVSRLRPAKIRALASCSPRERISAARPRRRGAAMFIVAT